MDFLDKYHDKLLKAPRPKCALELAQMLYLANWISPSIHRLVEKRDRFKELVDLQGKTVKGIAENQYYTELDRGIEKGLRRSN